MHDEPVDLRVRLEAGCDFADLFEVKDALKKKGTYSARVEAARLVLAYERETFARATAISSSRAGADRRERPDASRFASGPTASGAPSSTSSPGRCSAIEEAARSEDRRRVPAACEKSLDGVARRGAAPRVRLGAAEGDLPPQPGRPRRAPLLAARRGRPQPAGGRAAVVHGDVRPRQHPHQPAGAAVRARARGDDAARARRLAGHARRRLPRRGARAGSCTSCATAR